MMLLMFREKVLLFTLVMERIFILREKENYSYVIEKTKKIISEAFVSVNELEKQYTKREIQIAREAREQMRTQGYISNLSMIRLILHIEVSMHCNFTCAYIYHYLIH